jgi:phosphonatase-like hydrolase
MMMDTAIRLIAFDVAGTTVTDEGLVISAFKQAFADSESELWATDAERLTEYALATMGQSKIEVFTALTGDAERAENAVKAFEKAYFEAVREQGVKEIPGAGKALAELKERGILLSLNTGFSREILNLIIDQLGWKSLIDFTITPQEAGAGRPSPRMLIRTADALNLSDPDAVVIVGDTIADMKAGEAFGAAQKIGVLTGTHSESELRGAGATSVINSVALLPSLL